MLPVLFPERVILAIPPLIFALIPMFTLYKTDKVLNCNESPKFPFLDNTLEQPKPTPKKQLTLGVPNVKLGVIIK